jgi:hypothetical protein
MQKVFEPNESFDIGIGTQPGVSATTSSQQTEYMSYGWCVEGLEAFSPDALEQVQALRGDMNGPTDITRSMEIQPSKLPL